MTEILIIDGQALTQNDDGSMHRSSLAELIEALQFARTENQVLRNLVENLEPGPISQALAENRYKQALAEPLAWRAEDGRLISHELKTTLTPRSATAAFTEPLYPSRHGGYMLRRAVGQLLDALPTPRDWLYPDVEKVLRAETGKPRR